MRLRLRYFASLGDAAGRAEEELDTLSATPRALYAELAARHGFRFVPEKLRVAVNGAFAAWEHALADGDEVVFLPPVSGG
jgi:molybdopterin synthase sulfur carrier subunit